ncbi:MAG: Rieske 2Fe-2S domain-containing protein [Mangrovibacterium sp.]
MVQQKPTLNRRRFLTQAIGWLAGIQVFYLLFQTLRPNKPARTTDNFYPAGDASMFKPGQVYAFGAAHFYLVRTDDGGFLALSSKCTHLGCAVGFNPGQKRFECPCHASVFSEKGDVLSSPALRALDYFPIEVVQNQVLVDIHSPIKRQKYELAQVKYI